MAGLPPKVLTRLSFPLAQLSKPEVREIAARHDLSVAGKAESQDLCFLAGQGKRKFLRRHAGLDDQPGEIRGLSGESLGRHRGHHHYTVGQRRGLGVAATEPLYVVATNAEENTVILGPRTALETHTVAIRDVTLHRSGRRVDAVKLRYRSSAVPARLTDPDGGTPSAGSHAWLNLDLERPFAGAAPGQAAVLFSAGLIIGHATIAAEPRRAVSAPVEAEPALVGGPRHAAS